MSPPNDAPRQPLLRAEALVRRFRIGSPGLGRRAAVVHAVEGVSLELPRGATLGVVGESGSGKSTLARLLLGLLPPTAGRVCFDGQDLAALAPAALRRVRRRMQLVFQDPYGALNPRLRVGAIVAEPFEIHQPTMSSAARAARVRALLERVGLGPEHAARGPAELSGGQRQRVVLARALAVEPELLVADEPVSALDVSIQAQILNLLADLRAERGLTMVFISHDLKVVEQVADEVAVMYLGRLVERAPTGRLFAEPRHPYTQALLSAIPDPRPGHRRPRILLAGEVPSPLAPPSGCAFHPRCPLRPSLPHADAERCAREVPALRVLDEPTSRACACHHAERGAAPAALDPG